MHSRISAETPRNRTTPSDFATAVVNNRQAITRPDGCDDIVYLPTVCPMVADYISEPVLVALALLGANKRRIQTKFVREVSPNGKLTSRFLVRAYGVK